MESSLTEFSLIICVGHSLYTKEKQVEEKEMQKECKDTQSLSQAF